MWKSSGKQKNNLNIKFGCYLLKEWEGIVVSKGLQSFWYNTVLFSENECEWWAQAICSYYLEWCTLFMGFPGGSAFKNLPEVQEMLVRSLGQGDPLEEGMATQSSILAWRIPWTEEPGGLQCMGPQTVRHDLVAKHRGTVNLTPFCVEGMQLPPPCRVIW